MSEDVKNQVLLKPHQLTYIYIYQSIGSRIHQSLVITVLVCSNFILELNATDILELNATDKLSKEQFFRGKK